jgi:hypothetical protein
MEIGKAKTIDEAKHLPSNISADYRKWIALWIMDKCMRGFIRMSHFSTYDLCHIHQM